MRKTIIGAAMLIMSLSPVWAQSACDIAGGAVRLHMTSEACKAPLNERGKAALAAARTRPAIAACMAQALGRIKLELQEALKVGGEPGVKLWCDLQRQTLKSMLK